MRRELIGLDIEITKAKSNSLVGLIGKVVDETKNTIVIENNNKKKTILKSQVMILIKNKGVIIDGKDLVGRVEERIR